MDTLKIISWNVNGIRAALKKGFMEFVTQEQPDILCLQETKASKDQVEIDLTGYFEFWNSAEKKGYSGTAIFSKIEPISVAYDIPVEFYAGDDLFDKDSRDSALEGRVIVAEFKNFYVATVYTPNAKDDLSRLELREKQWDPAFLNYMTALQKNKPVIFCGDLNVAHKEIDLARPKQNIGKKGFTIEERKGIDKYIENGFVDTFRLKHGEKEGNYTWWSYFAKSRERNIGWRIDYFFVSEILSSNIEEAFIKPEVEGSDHCPVGITLNIT